MNECENEMIRNLCNEFIFVSPEIQMRPRKVEFGRKDVCRKPKKKQ